LTIISSKVAKEKASAPKEEKEKAPAPKEEKEKVPALQRGNKDKASSKSPSKAVPPCVFSSFLLLLIVELIIAPLNWAKTLFI